MQGGGERLSSKQLGNGYGGMNVANRHEMRNCREKKSVYIKKSAVATMWSWLYRCELSANLVEQMNHYTGNRGIKSLNAGVILCLMVLTHSFAMSSKMPD